MSVLGWESIVLPFHRDPVGTRYVCLAVRILVDPNTAGDLDTANVLQDRLVVTQTDPGRFEIPDWSTSVDRFTAG